MYCRHCGTEIAGEPRFCPDCGGSQAADTARPDPTAGIAKDVKNINGAVTFVVVGICIVLGILFGQAIGRHLLGF